MALQSKVNPPNINELDYIGHTNENHQKDHYHHGYDEEIDETENTLIENYRFLTHHCGALRQSPTTELLNIAQQKQINQQSILRYNSFRFENVDDEYERTFSSNKQQQQQQQHPTLNDLNNNNHNYSTPTTTGNTHIPPTVYYEDASVNEIDTNNSFSLIKLFTRMKTHLKHDKRYRPKPTHELLSEEDPQEWYELTKNVRAILTKVLITDPEKDKSSTRTKKVHTRKGSCRKARESISVLTKTKDDEEKIHIEIDEHLNSEGDEEFDQVILNKYATCARGPNYRRCGVCKTVDRQLFQGQLLFFYGVANNILIDENLKASGLG